MSNWLTLVSTLATLITVVIARDTLREARLARIEDGWRHVLDETAQLRLLAEDFLKTEDALREAERQVREATHHEWVRLYGGPEVFRLKQLRSEGTYRIERARERLEHAMAGRYGTPELRKLIRAEPMRIAIDAPSVFYEVHDILNQMRGDRGWWFRSPTPLWRRCWDVAINAVHSFVLMPALAATYWLARSVSRPWRGFREDRRDLDNGID